MALVSSTPSSAGTRPERYTFTNVRIGKHVDATAPGQVDNETIEGWTYGIGGEVAVSEKFSVSAEVRAEEMDETRFSFAGYDEGLTPNTTSVRVSFNWHPF